MKELENFERNLLLSKAKAYSNISLERELTDEELNTYKQTMEKLGAVI